MKPINPKRRQSEFARTYHSKARVAWVKAQPCVVCGNTPSENAHVDNGGAGRKAGYQHIVPLCATHHRQQHANGWASLGWAWDDLRYRVEYAEYINAEWERYAAED